MVRPSQAEAAVFQVKGYNDDFIDYAEHPTVAADAIDRLRTSGATCIRTGLIWPQFQPLESYLGQPYADWTNIDRFAKLRFLANLSGVKILPHFNMIPNFARSPTGGCLPMYLDAWGQFVAEVVRVLDEEGLVNAIEIGNEPNTYYEPSFDGKPPGTTNDQWRADRNPWCMTYLEFAELITYAYIWIELYRSENLIKNPIRIISGGLFAKSQGTYTKFRNGLLPGGGALNWREYLSNFQRHTCADYAVGFHPYDLGPYNQGAGGTTEVPVGSQISENICQLFDEAATLTPRDIWVTETGATSRTDVPVSVGETTQAAELFATAWGLASRPKCKCMIVHRFYDKSQSGNGSEPAGNPFHRFGVFKDIESPLSPLPNKVWAAKPSYSTLNGAWSVL